jgi:hypothetical protein
MTTNFLGLTVKDRITGFQGAVTGYVQYLTGCNQVLVVPPLGADGALRDAQWFDVQRVDVVQHIPRHELDNGANPGCDKAAPKR